MPKLVLLASFSLIIFSALVAPSLAATGQASNQGAAEFAPTPATTPGLKATLAADGRTAVAPVGAPLPVQKAIWAANEITTKPYLYGGGHGKFKDRGYDCSGTISYALNGGGLLDSPLDSSSFMSWGERGKGNWITVYTNPGHAYVMIAGLRLDTSGRGEKGPRWRPEKRSTRGLRARHPQGL
ncbi:MAG: hypothetical protein WAP35_00860 [Solirubrobacterales bacterium]